ncbi:MAG: response regulator [Anaerolineae bacterium]|nr:response regulator [Phycisphaerae bacterium]
MHTILLIEDNEMNRDMLSRRLTRAGYDVIAVANATDGIDLAQARRPAIVLMDLRLPEFNGWDAAKLLKSDPQTRDIPLIALTAHAMEGDRERALAAGCDDYDTKPIDLPRLLEKIRVQLDLTASHRPHLPDDTGPATTMPAG